MRPHPLPEPTTSTGAQVRTDAHVRRRIGDDGGGAGQLTPVGAYIQPRRGTSTTVSGPSVARMPSIKVCIRRGLRLIGVNPAPSSCIDSTLPGWRTIRPTIARCSAPRIGPEAFASGYGVAKNGNGVALEHGRARRVATAAQRRALRAMYRTCGHPHCQVGFADCDIHHVVPWQCGGVTDVANLLPLCSKHHHLVHEGGWHLALHPDRTIELRRPDGTVAFEGSAVDVAPTGTTSELDRLIRARAHALAPPGHAA